MMMRNLASSVARVATRSAGRTARPTFRAFSDFQKKERSEEQRYFAAQEAEKIAAMRAKMEAILASDNQQTKEELIDILGAKQDAPKDFIHKYGLNDWKIALPVGMVAAIPALGNEWLILDAETQLVAVFVLFCSTVYMQLGGSVASTLDDYRNNVFTTLKKVDESMLVDIKASIAANENVLDMEKDISSVHKLIDDMCVVKAETLNYAEEHKYRDAIVRKLDSLVAIEEAAVVAIRNRMLTAVKAEVVTKFSSDAKAKAAALDHALAVLSAGKTGKIGKDIVGDVYAASLKSYRESYSKLAPGSDAILKQLEKDVAAAVAAPAVEVTGGNVYVTHPVA